MKYKNSAHEQIIHGMVFGLLQMEEIGKIFLLIFKTLSVKILTQPLSNKEMTSYKQIQIFKKRLLQKA